MNGLRFSVIVTNYNYREFVGEAVDSVLNQALAPAEVIVVDDGSTDGSAKFLQQAYGADPRVRLVLKDNGGQLSAFIAGMHASSADTDIVCFLDADDFWAPEYLASLRSAYGEPAAPDFVFTNLRFTGAREGLWSADSADHDFGLTALPTLFMQEWVGAPTSALSMRRELALRMFSVPPAFLPDWRVRADDYLVYAAGALGARKRYAATAHVRYRAHGNNLHLDRGNDRIAALRYLYRVQKLLAWLASQGGFGADSLRYTKLEFKTKSAPTRYELGVYLRLLRRAPLGLFKKIEQRISIYRWYLRGCRQAVKFAGAPGAMAEHKARTQLP